MKKYLFILLFFTGITALAQPTSGDIYLPDTDTTEVAEREPTPEAAQQSFESVLVTAFKSGNAQRISTYFGENVDLSILGKENLYSKSQAQQVLQHFFTEHKPADFKVIHKEKAKSSEYFIGVLTSEKGESHRVTINSKQEGAKKGITSLAIEEN